MITGKFENTKSENFEEYMKAIGVSMVNRQIASKLKPTIEITINGDVYTLKTKTSVKNTEINCKLNEEFDEETLDGKPSKSKMTCEGNKLIHVQNTEGKTLKMTREFSDSGMVLTLEGGGVVAKRWYNRV